MGILSACGSHRCFDFFEQLCSIPHGSGNTKAISDWIVSFAVSHGLKYVQDGMNNVVVFKDASAGFEKAAPIIIQGHIDMVCVHTDDYDVDMKRIPVSIRTDGHFIWADRTSLGGDNGLAVAIMLAILERDDLNHPAIEAVFTSDEEPGMYGAKALDCSVLKGRRIINLDCGPEGSCTVTCAGGTQLNTTIPATFEDNTLPCIRICVDGLCGGHSGNMIGLGRANANVVLLNAISILTESFPVHICDINGGSGENVIPSSATAIIALNPSDIGRAKETIGKYLGKIQAMYPVERYVSITVEGCSTYQRCVNSSKSAEICTLAGSLPSGLQAWDESFTGLPRTSLNMGILKTNRDGIEYHHYIRSSVDAEKQALVDVLSAKAGELGGKPVVVSDYSGWKYNPVSPLRDLYFRTYEEIKGVRPVESKTHGGLECGTFYAKISGADIIAIGADQKEVHSVKERLDAQSMVRLYDLVVRMLSRLSA